MWGLSFLRSPVEILPSTTTDRVSSIRLEINRLEVRCVQMVSAIFLVPLIMYIHNILAIYALTLENPHCHSFFACKGELGDS